MGSGNLAMSDHRVRRRCAFGPVDVAGPAIQSILPDITGRSLGAPRHNERSSLCETQNGPAEGAVNQGTGTVDAAAGPSEAATQHQEQRVQRLIGRLPGWLQATVRWLRRPGLRWVRVAAGVLFIAGSFLSILPIFGIWMLPLGLLPLAEDIPVLRRARDRLLDWIERHRPHWLAGSNADNKT